MPIALAIRNVIFSKNELAKFKYIEKKQKTKKTPFYL